MGGTLKSAFWSEMLWRNLSPAIGHRGSLGKLPSLSFGSCLELIFQYVMFSYFLGSSEWTTEPCSSVLLSCTVFGSMLGEVGKMRLGN